MNFDDSRTIPVAIISKQHNRFSYFCVFDPTYPMEIPSHFCEYALCFVTYWGKLDVRPLCEYNPIKKNSPGLLSLHNWHVWKPGSEFWIGVLNQRLHSQTFRVLCGLRGISNYLGYLTIYKELPPETPQFPVNSLINSRVHNCAWLGFSIRVDM